MREDFIREGALFFNRNANCFTLFILITTCSDYTRSLYGKVPVTVLHGTDIAHSIIAPGLYMRRGFIIPIPSDTRVLFERGLYSKGGGGGGLYSSAYGTHPLYCYEGTIRAQSRAH